MPDVNCGRFTRTFNLYKAVGMIVVGEEGGGRNRWRTHFIPQVGANKQRLSEKIANQRGGWHFVRIYNKDDDLLESMDFRFIIGLKSIRVERYDSLPGPKGYDSVSAQFLHCADCAVELIGQGEKHVLKISRESDKTIVTVPPEPSCDETRWILCDGDAEVTFVLLIERIWWGLGTLEQTPTDWMDKPITLSRKDFTAISNKALWIKFPRLRFISRVNVGLDKAKSRPFQVDVDKTDIAVRLREFCDTMEIEKKQGKLSFMIWAQVEGTKNFETVIAQIDMEPHVSVRPKPSSSKIEAFVICQRRKRRSKGFSKAEIITAGLSLSFVLKQYISYDKRRKTVYTWNIESLIRLMECVEHTNSGV
jgi:ribosomal protein L13E